MIMFESAELGHKIDNIKFDKELPKLRDNLLKAQVELARHKKYPVVIIIGGVDGAGKGEIVNVLNEWMDPRHIQTHAYDAMSEEEAERPEMWRFWRDLPPRGSIGIFFGSWYTSPIVDRVLGNTKKSQFESELDEILRFEKMLASEGTLVLKFWLHLGKDAQKKRLKALEKDKKTRWRVTPEDWKRFKKYDNFRKISEGALRKTNRSEAPWIVVEGSDSNYRSLTVGSVVLKAINERNEKLEQKIVKKIDKKKVTATPRKIPKIAISLDGKDVLHSLDLKKKIERKEYKELLEKYQGKLNLLSRDPRLKKLSVILAFEGNDAAGKGGTIRRITGALDARKYGIIPVAAPTEEERAQPYLWRFWRKLPRKGRFTIFDRTWYGRVLVERVEGFCKVEDWKRAYSEINDFENQLIQNNSIVIKFWLAISSQEQLKRFKEREKISFKKFKITDEDWRNRNKWPDYENAVCDMVEQTSTDQAPWTLVEANDKYHARIKVLKTICERLESALK
jgi:polyphosphate:AMP phosphotransferase